MKKILILNGPNLNLLGRRDPKVYGNVDFESFLSGLQQRFADKASIEYAQSNVEGELIDTLHGAVGKYDAVILNAGGYTHTSVALADAVGAVMDLGLHVSEVHISNVASREPFRHTSFLTPRVDGLVMGYGLESYTLAINYYLY